MVGRSKGGAQVQLEGDGALSRRHARIWADAAGVWYEDLGSSNGSWLNGVRLVSPTLLMPGMEVLLGQTRLTVDTEHPDLELPPGMELRGEGRAGAHGLTAVLGGREEPAARYMSALYDIVEGLLGADGGGFIPRAMERVCEVVPAAQRVALVAWPPSADGEFVDLVHFPTLERAPVSQSLARYAVEQGRALLLSDLPVQAVSVVYKGIKSAVYVPLATEATLARDHATMGLLCVDSTDSVLPLTSDHFQFICAVAGLLASTLAADRLREEARRQQLTAQRLEARREGLVSFLQIASHDLKNPLTAIANGARLLPRVKSEQQPGLLNVILGASHRANDLIKAYLDVSEVESGHALRAEREKIDARQLVEEEIAFLRTALPERVEGMQLTNRVEVGEISADPRKLRQIIANLVSNAIKYSPSKGEIVIEGFARQNEVVFSVQDQGVGISEADQKRLFSAFSRVGDLSLAPGTGLGLWLTAALVEAHGGRMSVESAPGHGSTFSFNLPQ